MDYIEKIKSGATTAFIDSTNKSSTAYKPEFISNDHTNGVKVLTTVLDFIEIEDPSKARTRCA